MRLSLNIGLFARILVLLFLAGNALLLILIIISGTTQSYPINRFYWVEADTSGIPNAAALTRWTFWGACGTVNGKMSCGSDLSAAYPISPKDNFHTEENVPHKFISSRDSFYFLSRFSFSFFWVALAFVGVSFILYILTWCSEIILLVVFILMAFGCLFNTAAVVFQTAVTVMAKNAFHNDGRHAKIGISLMAMGWASVFLSIVEFLVLAYWFVSRNYIQSFRSGSLGEKHRQNNFFHRDTEPLSVPEPIMAQDPYSPNPNVNIAATPDMNVNNNQDTNALPPIQPTLVAPTQNAPVQEGNNAHRGINFFTIRRAQKQNQDDESI